MPKVSFPTVSWPGGVGAFQPFPLSGGARRRLRKGTGKRRLTRNRRRQAKKGGRRTRRA